MGWSERDLPDLTGRTVVVTGASAGLGLETSRALAARGARVVLATRDAVKTAAAADRVRRAVPGAVLEHVQLDLADLSSVRDAAAVIRDRHDAVHVLVCNAGLMATPERRTVDGFELQLGVNHLGHAALTALLLGPLAGADDPRVVVVSSEMHRIGRIDLDDLDWERRTYRRWAAYGQSKLANLLYVRELARRLDRAASRITVAAAHPGYAATELQTKGTTMTGGPYAAVAAAVSRALNATVARSAAQGALPQLYAATAPGITSGSYWGPRGLGGSRGAPGPASPSAAARDDRVARALFDRTEELVGVSHDLAA